MGNIPEDLERAPLVIEDEPAVEVAPRAAPTTPGEWVRRNLFSSLFSGLLTVTVGAGILYFSYRLLRWIFVTADWSVVKANLRLFMVGRFPEEHLWRVWAAGYLVVLLGGVSWGVSAAKSTGSLRRIAFRVVLIGVLVGALIYLLEGVRIWFLVGGMAATCALGIAVGRAGGRRLRLPLAVAWTLAFPIVVVILRAFGGVPPRLWGGFVLNILLAVVGIFLSFPFGILLALGRRSALPAIHLFSVGFIEFIRGVPLVALLIFGQFVLPLFLPPGMRLPDIIRAMTMFTVFSAAYVAEIVRGGMQGIPQGQYEAARALGLSNTRMMAMVVLPQALRSTIPAMISHFISLFKDTSLIVILGLPELLALARRAPVNLQFIGREKEALLAAALIFWLVAFFMSRWSQRLERRLGVGER